MESRVGKHLRSSIVIGALALAVGTVWAEQQQQHEKARRPLPRVASLSELRAQSPEDRAAAAFFSANRPDRPIQPGADIQIVPGAGLPPLPAGIPRPSYEDFLRRLVCRADAVVTAEATQERVLLNSKETYLLTKYAVRVDSWIYPNRPHGQHVIPVYVDGGAVEVAGRLTRVRTAAGPLEPGTSYLFFLKRIHGSDGYAIARKPIADANELSEATTDLFQPDPVSQGTIAFGQLVNDLAVAGQTCDRSK